MIMNFTLTSALGQSPKGKFSVAGIDDENEVRDFLSALQDRLRAHDRRAIADMMDLPNKFLTARGAIYIQNKRDFVKKFDIVFDKNVSKVVLCQDFDGLEVTDEGIGIGRGTVWIADLFQGKNEEFDPERDLEDRKKWKLKVAAVNGGHWAEERAAECQGE
jgi:hypothetical protein